ncbi:MAG: hypothetical protein AAFV95_17970 [Bacteroidota bacterium]
MIFPNEIATYVIIVFLVASLPMESSAQANDSSGIATRLFMPALQMGYINHKSDVISGGLVIQTSLEYRAKSNLLVRLNYDDFSGRITINDANDNKYVAKIPLSEFMGGIGYRLSVKKHNLFGLVQSGIRFYELPEIEEQNGIITINQSGERIVPVKYTVGYEYEIMENIFLNLELFTGHFVKKKDYWSNDQLYLGIMAGLSTTLF